MLEIPRSLLRHRRLFKDLVVRDLKARYVGSSMGFFWSVIFPIINLFVYMFVFRLILAVRFEDNASESTTALWMLAGIVVWASFAETVSRATNCLVENSNLIQKVVFPSEVLPVYLTTSSLINMTIGFPVVLAGVGWFILFPDVPDVDVAALVQGGKEILPEPPHRPLAIGLSLVSIPVLMVAQGIFTAGLGYFLSTLNLILRDTYHLVGVFVMVWMFGTPIFYPAKMVEARSDGAYAWILDVNPMHWLIESYRAVLLFGEWPDPWLLGRFLVVALAVFGLGAAFFRSQKDRFPDLL